VANDLVCLQDGGVTGSYVKASLDVKDGWVDDLELLYDVVEEVVPRQLRGNKEDRKGSAIQGHDPYTDIVGGW